MTLDRKDLTPEMIRKVGLRIKACRVLTGLNQEQFADKFKIPYTTIRNWEYGQVIPRKQSMMEFINSLNSCNVFVEADWLLAGSGLGPYFQRTQPNNHVNSSVYQENIENFRITCLKQGEDPIITKIIDNSMSPLFCSGEVVCGILINPAHQIDLIKSYLKKREYPFLIRLADGNYVPRKLMVLGDKIIYGTNSFDMNVLINPVIAKIHLHFINQCI